jgi:uncharacterized damage-inducible protein DinB
MRKIFTLVLITLTVNFSYAQLADSLKAQMLRDWERSKAYTKEYLDAMPKDKYGFKAQDSVRSFAQQMLHLAQGNVGIASMATGKPAIWQNARLENSKTAQSYDSVNYYVLGSYDFVIEAIKNFDVSKFAETTGSGRFSGTRMALLLKVLEHQAHHRGQTTIYIRLLGIKPPNERLF